MHIRTEFESIMSLLIVAEVANALILNLPDIPFNVIVPPVVEIVEPDLVFRLHLLECLIGFLNISCNISN